MNARVSPDLEVNAAFCRPLVRIVIVVMWTTANRP